MTQRKPARSRHAGQLYIRFTLEMLEEIREQAAREELTVSDYLRNLHTQHIQQVKEQEKRL